MLEAELPQIIVVVSVILAIAALHGAYFRIVDSFNSQMRLGTDQMLGSATITLTDGLEADTEVRRYDLARTPSSGRIGHSDRPEPSMRAIGHRGQSRKGLRKIVGNSSVLKNGFASRGPRAFGPARVFDSDVCLESDATFFVPVKVMGDLEINGNVEFNETVIVDGMMVVRGPATFLGGVVVKGDVIVDGLAILDSDVERSWLVGRKLRGRGILAESKIPQRQEMLRLVS